MTDGVRQDSKGDVYPVIVVGYGTEGKPQYSVMLGNVESTFRYPAELAQEIAVSIKTMLDNRGYERAQSSLSHY